MQGDGLSKEERRAILVHEIRDVLNGILLKPRPDEDIEIRTWPGRIKAAWLLINQPGGLAVIILAVFLLLYTGYLPSPITALAGKLEAHETATAQRGAARQEIDKQLTATLSRLADEIGNRNKRDRIRECDGIRDPDVKRACLGL